MERRPQKTKFKDIKSNVKKEDMGLPDIVRKMLFILFMIFAILFLLNFSVGGPSVFDELKYLLNAELGSVTSVILGASIVGATIISIFIFFVALIFNSTLKLKINIWFILGAFVMFWLFLAGFSFIESAIGVKTVHGWNLQSPPPNIVGQINCNSETTGEAVILINDTAICKYTLPWKLTNATTSVEIVYNNNTHNHITSMVEPNNYNITFNASANVRYLSFEINGINEKGMNVSATDGYPNTFLSPEEYKQNTQTFLSYILGLFALIFVTAPIAINELKKLWRGTN
ncbi:MAG: hypothetical protein WCK29_00185 [archaeon]